MKPHKHAEIIKAWADGAQIQYKNEDMVFWEDMPVCNPNWFESVDYRIKRDPKPDVIKYFSLESHPVLGLRFSDCSRLVLENVNNLIKVTFDNESCTIKNVEVIG